MVSLLGIPLDFGGVCSADRAGSVSLEPLVDTLGMELMVAGQNSQQLTRLKVTHTHHTQGLLRLVIAGVESVGRQLFYISFSQTTWFGFPKTLGQVQQSLVILHFSIIYVQL